MYNRSPSLSPFSNKTPSLYGLATQPAAIQIQFKSFELLKFHKISRLSNSGLKIGNLTNFIMLFSSLATILYHQLFLRLTWSPDPVLQRAY